MNPNNICSLCEKFEIACPWCKTCYGCTIKNDKNIHDEHQDIADGLLFLDGKIPFTKINKNRQDETSSRIRRIKSLRELFYAINSTISLKEAIYIEDIRKPII